MGLATVEMRRAKLRFGLLTIAVALLVFLILLLTTLSNALISSLVGALKGLDTQGLVYSTSSQDNIAASRLAPETVAAVAAVPGVTAAAGVGTFTASASVARRQPNWRAAWRRTIGAGSAPAGRPWAACFRSVAASSSTLIRLRAAASANLTT